VHQPPPNLNIRRQLIIPYATLDLLRARQEVPPRLEPHPHLQHAVVALAHVLQQARAAALGAELAEDGEGAVEMGEGSVKSSGL